MVFCKENDFQGKPDAPWELLLPVHDTLLGRHGFATNRLSGDRRNLGDAPGGMQLRSSLMP